MVSGALRDAQGRKEPASPPPLDRSAAPLPGAGHPVSAPLGPAPPSPGIPTGPDHRRVPMTARALTALFDDYEAAASAVDQLEAAGIPHADISIISNRAEPTPAAPKPSTSAAPETMDAADAAGTGATVGTVLGGS